MMKKIIAFSLLALSTTAFSAHCPDDTELQYHCTSTPKAGDHEVAAQIFDSIDVCTGRLKSVLVFEKRGATESLAVRTKPRTGGTTYYFKSKNINYSLSVAAMNSTQRANARFNLKMRDTALDNASSTYTCQLNLGIAKY